MAQTGAAALAAVQDNIDALLEWDYITAGRTKRTGTRTTKANRPEPRDVKEHAEGGWAGLNGPELSWLGEKGPEYVIPNHALRSGMGGSGVTIQGVTEDEIMAMIDRGLYFRLQRKPT